MSVKSKHKQPWLAHRVICVGLLTLSSISSVSAETPTQTKTEEEPIKGTFPTLDILPEGSILRRVRLPRYDENFSPTSLLTADSMTVLDKQRIAAVDVSINLYAKDGSIDARSKMRRAIYDQKLSTLNASEAIFIEGKGYRANGTGIIFDWLNSQGLLLGPVKTEFKRTLPPKSTAMKLQPSTVPGRSIARSLMLVTSLSTSAMAEPPAKLTSAQLEEFDNHARPIKDLIAIEQQKTHSSLQEDTQRHKKARAAMEPFLKKVNQSNLLISTTDAKRDTAESKKESKSQGQGQEINKKPEIQTLKISCDGGLYFDTDTGILAYLKNIRLTETSFNLTCSDELKVFLEKSPEAKTENKKKGELSKFGELERIIATGNVKITRKDEQGRTFIATAESSSYNAKTGEMILKGGKPRLQLGPNQFLQSLAPGQWIRILRNGKFITEGKWTMVTPLPQGKGKR